MAKYSGTLLGITPTATAGNWWLEGQSSRMASILEVSWGGEVTTSTNMRTRVARNSNVGTTRTTGNVQSLNPNSASNTTFFVSSYSTPPTISAGSLFSIGWNAHGGAVRWVPTPGEEFLIIGAQSIECRNDGSNTAASTYNTIWDDF